MASVGIIAALLAGGCRKDEPTPVTETPSALLDVPESETWAIPGLTGEAYVVRVEDGIPYVYAETRADLARVVGFVVARDRYFTIDLIRRLAEGRLSELLGDEGLAPDEESRGIGMTRVTDQALLLIEADPEWTAIADGYAEGVTAYVDQVQQGRLPVPSELETLGPVLGRPEPADMMTGFDRRDIAAVTATLIYNLGFETTDVGRAAAWDTALSDSLFAGVQLEDERKSGIVDDVLLRVEPVYPVASAPGWGDARRGAPIARTGAPSARRPSGVPAAVLSRLKARMDRIERRFSHDRDSGFGSNAWAVAGSVTADGRSLLAGDGHLSLSVPPLFYQIGMDTEELGGGDIHQVGLAFPGFPTLAVGTNGLVAWCQTQLFGDITDWYSEQLTLDAQGLPASSRFGGAEQPLVRVDETYEIADVPLLGSVGRTETWPRFETFDGRLLSEIEGDVVSPDTVPNPGQALVNVQGTTIIPRDIDGDGVVSAVSFDYTAFDAGNLPLASDGFGRATDVGAFREATKKLVAYSQNLIASDADGDVFYSGYQAVPCRGYLPRNPDGTFADGADPMRLIDGTKYGGFTVPVGPDGVVDESQGDDPYRCVVPFEAYPQVTSPPQGYVLTANNDIGNITTDGDLFDDPYYIGGPWLEGYRANRIDHLLADEAANGTADIAAMSRIQGDHHSTVGEQLLPILLQSFDVGRAAAQATPGEDPLTDRIAALWTGNEARFTEVESRLSAWQDAGLPARAGVETFYQTVEPGDLDHAAATMLWNAWIGQYVSQVFDDEGFPSVWYPTGDTGRTRTLTRMLAGRGPGNPEGMASWSSVTGESAFFDVVSTPELESSDEIALLSLQTALDVLTAPPTGNATGGFGTADMSQWLWGYRHLAKFESLLSEVIDPDDGFGFILDLFAITPDDELPLDPDMSPVDPRAFLPGFPRHGDHLNVDAGNPGFARDEWMYTSGPVFRMVIALGPDGAEGVNVLPGGQSGLVDSPFYADQAALWLGNQTLPLHTSVPDVVAAGVGRETFR